MSSLIFFQFDKKYLNHPIWIKTDQARADLLFVTVMFEHHFACFDLTKTAINKRKSFLGSPKQYATFIFFVLFGLVDIYTVTPPLT